MVNLLGLKMEQLLHSKFHKKITTAHLNTKKLNNCVTLDTLKVLIIY